MAKVKDIAATLANFEEGTMSNKGKARISLYDESQPAVTIIPTGIPKVDAASGCGGLPLGKIIEVFGPESGGKSWFSMRVGASAQSLGYRVLLIDIEHSFDPVWARKSAGLDVSKLLYGHDFENGEQALQYVLGACRDNIADVIIVDSTAALIPKAELEANLEDNQMGVRARMISRAVTQISDACGKSNTMVIFVNQIREKLGVMFGNPQTTPGGHALKFYAGMRIEVRRLGVESDTIGDGDDAIKVPICIKSKLKFIKNKVALPYGEAEFQINFDSKLNDPYVRLVKTAYELKVLKRKSDEDDKKVFIWGSGKDAEFTGCEDAVKMAEWVVSSSKVLELVGLVKEVAAEKGVQVPSELLSLTDSNDPALEVEAPKP